MVKSSEVKSDRSAETGSVIEAYPDPFNTVVLNAIYENATDIHLNKIEGGMLILYRVDGIIYEKQYISEAE